MASVHQGEEKPHLNRFNLNVANFVYQEAVIAEIFAQQFGFGMIRTGSVELGQQFGKEHVTAAIALVKSVALVLMFPTMPVGVPSVPAGLDGAGGTVTKFVVPPLAITG